MLISELSHCALIIVIELASNYDTKGVLLEEIARKHYLPMESLTPASEQLCAAGLLSEERAKDDVHYLFLNRQPQDMCVFDVVQIFDSEIFAGKFLDVETDKWLPQSHAARLINYERKQYLQYIKSKLRKINIKRWCEIMNRSGVNYIMS